MNPEDIIRYINQVNALKESYDDIKKALNGIRINEQLWLKANEVIPPGIACKVAYDQNGLVLRGERLQATDIPELPIDHINGLRTALGDKAAKSDLERLKKEVEGIGKIQKGPAIGSGSKVNYDAIGLVVSVSDLLPSDIPTLPIEKIDGLADIIRFLKDQHKEGETTNVLHPTVNPTTATKVTYDKYGHILKGEQLGMNDLPAEIVSKVNSIESRLPNFAAQTSLDTVVKGLTMKLDANTTRMTPGTYTKVRVDEKGLVSSGDKLSLTDLPALAIQNIVGLSDALRDKAEQSSFIELHETVSRITESIDRLGDTSSIKRDLTTKANQSDFKSLEARIESIQKQVDKVLNIAPGDTIMAQIESIVDELTTLAGRVALLEKKNGVSN